MKGRPYFEQRRNWRFYIFMIPTSDFLLDIGLSAFIAMVIVFKVVSIPNF